MDAFRALAAIRPPMSLSASGGLTSISLNWLAPQTTAFSTSDYIVSRGTVSGGPYTLIGSTPNGSTLSFTDPSPNPGMSYYYVVQAVDAKGNTTVVSNEAVTVSTGPTWTPTLTNSPTITLTPTMTYTPTLTLTFTLSPTPSRTGTFTATTTFTPTPTPTLTATPTETPCGYPGFTCTPTLNPSTLLYNPIAYPNPVRGNTVNFTYQLSVPADQVTFKIFTVSFRKIADFKGTTNAGNNNVPYDTSHLANGLYFYVLKAGENGNAEQKIGKVLVLR